MELAELNELESIWEESKDKIERNSTTEVSGRSENDLKTIHSQPAQDQMRKAMNNNDNQPINMGLFYGDGNDTRSR